MSEQIKDSKGNEVKIEAIGYGDEVMVHSADYVSLEIEVPEDEIEWIEKNYAAELEVIAFERAIMKAEVFEGER